MIDKIQMPRILTVENGAKGLLIDEFFETVEIPCPDCEGDGDYLDGDDACGTCHGLNVVVQNVYVTWTTIKAIYELAVKHLGEEVKP